jgi:hypothetical protein
VESDAVIQAIGALSRKIDDEFGAVKDRIAQNADDSLKHHEQTRKDVAQIRGHVIALWRKVNGSDPPSPAQKLDEEGRVVEETPFGHRKKKEETLAVTVPLDELAEAGFAKASALDLEVAALRAETMTGFVKLDTQIKGVMSLNKVQSDYAGIGKKGRAYLFSREGIKATATLIAAVTGLVAALGTCYAIARPSPPTLLEAPHAPRQTQHP